MSIITKQIKFYATVATRERALLALAATDKYKQATIQDQEIMDTELLATTFTAKLPSMPDVITPESINEFFVDAGECFNDTPLVLMKNCIRWLIVKHRDSFGRTLTGSVTKAMQEQFALHATNAQLANWRKAKKDKNDVLANQIIFDA